MANSIGRLVFTTGVACAFWLVAAGALIPSVPSQARSVLYNSSFTVPGERIGTVKLGESEASAIHQLGRPTSSGTLSCDRVLTCMVSCWRSKNGGVLLLDAVPPVTGGATRTVSEIAVTNPYFRTRENIGPGSTLQSVETAFPGAFPLRTMQLSAGKNSNKIALLDDKRRGIAFEFPVIDGRLESNARCRAVTVHPKGQVGSNLYGPSSTGGLVRYDERPIGDDW